MKNHSLIKTVSALAIFVAGLTATATAGPDPMTFKPVMTMKAATKLKVGSEIAVSCGNCNGITVMAVDSERSYLKSFTCPMCKKTFTFAPGGGGRSASGFAYSDGAGHLSHLTAGPARLSAR